MAGKVPASNPLRPLGGVDANHLLRQRFQRRNRLLGLGILVGVASIYSCTILAVKQENFLDKEFDERINDATKSHES